MNPRPHDSTDPTIGPAATPIAFIRAMVLAHRRYGSDPAAALAAARISQAQLDDPAARVTAAQMEIMSGISMQSLDDEALGWFSRKLPWGSYGMLCRASITAPNLEVALRRWCRHHRLLTDDIILTLAIGGQQANLEITINRPLGELHEFCLVSILRMAMGYSCWVVDSRIPLLEASFPFPAPAHRDVYPLMFPGPLRFEAERAAIRFDARYLALPLRRDERALQGMLQRALPLTVLQYRRDRLLVQRVRQLLHAHPDEAATAERLAARLNVSPRTLHRQLLEEGASLQQLKDEARRDRAIELLNRSDRPLKQLAEAVGFKNEKSFARAFKQWTGSSPGAFREQARAARLGPPRASD